MLEHLLCNLLVLVRTFTLCSAAPAAWIPPCPLGSSSGAAATDTVVLVCRGPGSREGAWNMLGADLFFFPVIFTNRR